jgi:hypothetical protein
LDCTISRWFELKSDVAQGSYIDDSTIGFNVEFFGNMSAYCKASGVNGTLNGSCNIYNVGTCDLSFVCVEGTCLENLPARPHGVAGFPNVNGIWWTVGGSCANNSAYQPGFSLMQCGSRLLQFTPSNVRVVRGSG